MPPVAGGHPGRRVKVTNSANQRFRSNHPLVGNTVIAGGGDVDVGCPTRRAFSLSLSLSLYVRRRSPRGIHFRCLNNDGKHEFGTFASHLTTRIDDSPERGYFAGKFPKRLRTRRREGFGLMHRRAHSWQDSRRSRKLTPSFDRQTVNGRVMFQQDNTYTHPYTHTHTHTLIHTHTHTQQGYE